MTSENRLAVIIFVALLGALGVLLLANTIRDLRRPTIQRVVVISATDDDPVFRTGARMVDASTEVTIAAALLVERRWGPSQWFAPGPELVIDGQVCAAVPTTAWPEEDRELRFFWFSLEAPSVGGIQTPQELFRITRTRPFLAPEMGTTMVARGEPELHAAGGLAKLDGEVPIRAGTTRVMVRAEVALPGRLQALQVATSPGAENPEDPSVCRISRGLDPEWDLESDAGALFRLPSIEPPVGVAGDAESMADLVARRLAVSSRLFAITVSPRPEAIGESPVRLVGDPLRAAFSDGTPLRWGNTISTGSRLRAGAQWLVLVRDDGNGILDGPDLVTQAWRRPAVIVPFASAVERTTDAFALMQPAVGGDWP